MKWFEHRTTDRKDLESKLIKRKFGLAGQGIWSELQEIISEHMENDNIQEWGFVSPDHTMESLAKEIGCPIEQFKEFIQFCDDNLITEKRDGRLFCNYVLERMSEYARKILKKGKSENSDFSEIPENPRNNTTQHNTTQEFLNIGGSRPKTPKKLEQKETPVQEPIKGISSIGSVMKKKYKYEPPKKVGVSTSWQAQAFMDLDGLGWKVKSQDKGRILKSYKDEYEARPFAASTNQVYSYLKDYDKWQNMEYEAKMKYWFWLRAHGITGFSENSKKPIEQLN